MVLVKFIPKSVKRPGTACLKKEILHEPQMTMCAHSFCMKCYLKWGGVCALACNCFRKNNNDADKRKVGVMIMMMEASDNFAKKTELEIAHICNNCHHIHWSGTCFVTKLRRRHRTVVFAKTHEALRLSKWQRDDAKRTWAEWQQRRQVSRHVLATLSE